MFAPSIRRSVLTSLLYDDWVYRESGICTVPLSDNVHTSVFGSRLLGSFSVRPRYLGTCNRVLKDAEEARGDTAETCFFWASVECVFARALASDDFPGDVSLA